MPELIATLMALVGSIGIFILGTWLGKKRCLAGGVLGYLVPVVFSLTALTVAAAHGDGLDIWKTEQGVYTDMPERYSGESKPWKPSRDRLTPVLYRPAKRLFQHRTSVRHWSVITAVRVVPGVERCAGVYLGNTLVQGGVAVCRGERAVIRRERVKPRGSMTTTTDTVLLVGGRELMRIEGKSYNHRPRAVRRE